MYKLTFLALCLCIWQISFAQNHLTIEGTIIVSDNNDPNPVPGTIRWTGQDFEGFNGTVWKSLTCGCDNACPDDRYIIHSVLGVTSQSVQFQIETSQNLPLRLAYYPSANSAQIQYGLCEHSANYGVYGNEHVQTISGLNPATEYTIIIQTSQDVGNTSADCPTMIWEDISCPFTVTTLGNNGLFCLNDPASSQLTGPYQFAHDSNTSWGIHGGTPPPTCPNDPWLKVNVINGTFWGMGIRNALQPIQEEGWIAYDIKLINWNASQYGMKLPGPSAYETNGHSPTSPNPANTVLSYVTNIGGSGCGGSERAPQGPGATIQNGQIVGGAGKSWSARMAIGGVNTQYTSTGELLYELYHSETTNLGSDGRGYGESEQWRAQTGLTNESQILDENWHQIKHYIKLNSIGNNDGILRGYFDGVLRYERTDIHFTDNPQFRNIALFNNVYHGGSIPATDDFEVHIACIRYNAGPTDLTNNSCTGN